MERKGIFCKPIPPLKPGDIIRVIKSNYPGIRGGLGTHIKSDPINNLCLIKVVGVVIEVNRSEIEAWDGT